MLAMTDLTGERIQAFHVDIPQDDLDDLRCRLDRTRWPDELPDSGWAYGVPLGHLKALARYWRHEYDWRAAEARLNQWPQFTTSIDGTSIHFAHLRSAHPDAIPLLMTHGWPGSFAEFTEVAGPLTDQQGDPAFHLVLPSIPGFGLSGPTTQQGWEHSRVAAAFATLMERLGYPRYGVQGGDWGAAISRELGRAHPDRVIGVHLNLLPGAFQDHEPSAAELAALDPAERERTLASWTRYQQWRRDRQGYAGLQATRPQTLAYGLTDSPVGQLAWIVEKFKEWTYPMEDLPEQAIDRDLMLTDVMLYWLTKTAGSSAQTYYENMHASNWGQQPGATPTGVAVFAEDVAIRRYAERANNIVHWSEFNRGGHFAAMETPDLLVGDIRQFFRSLRAQK